MKEFFIRKYCMKLFCRHDYERLAGTEIEFIKENKIIVYYRCKRCGHTTKNKVNR